MLHDRTERERLASLKSYGIMDTPNEPEFETIIQAARAALRTPIVLISLLDEHRQWFKARIGLDVAETPRCISFCTHALLGPSVLVIPDAREDDRFAANPLVVGAPFVRFYAGAPLTTSAGRRLGTLCAIDTAPRPGLTGAQEKTMVSLAADTMAAMERRRARIARVIAGPSLAA